MGSTAIVTDGGTHKWGPTLNVLTIGLLERKQMTLNGRYSLPSTRPTHTENSDECISIYMSISDKRNSIK